MAKRVHHPRVAAFIKKRIRMAKAENDYSWQDISDLLANAGIEQSAKDLTSKYSKGEMQAELFLSILAVMGVDELLLSELRSGLSSETE